MAFIPRGSLAWSFFGEDPMVFTNPSGVVISPAPIVQVAAQCFGIAANEDGIFYATQSSGAQVFSSQLELLATPLVGPYCSSIAIDSSGRGYTVTASATVKRWTADGTVTGTTSTSALPPGGYTNIGVKPDGSIALVAGLVQRKVYGLDLGSGANLGILIDEIAAPNATGNNNSVVFLDSGEVLVAWHGDTEATTFNGFVKRYNAGYDTVATYPTSGLPACLTKGLDDTSFWCASLDGTTSVIVEEFRISDGVVLHSFTKPYAGYSGAFCVVRADISTEDVPVPAPPKIPVVKCAPQSIISSPSHNAGCSKGGTGWRRTYNGPSGSVPIGADPVDGETMTGKTSAHLWIELTHSAY